MEAVAAPVVTLSPADMAYASVKTNAIYWGNRQRGISEMTIDGAGKGYRRKLVQEFYARCGEIAVMRWAGVPVRIEVANSNETFDLIAHDRWDVPGVGEVKHTLHGGGGLLVMERHPSDRPYILVRGWPCFEIAGWLPGVEVKQPKWWNTVKLRSPGYLVPAEELNPMSTLPIDRESLSG